VPPNPVDDLFQDSIGFRAEFAKTFSECNRNKHNCCVQVPGFIDDLRGVGQHIGTCDYLL
jgi:hypothetical protein